MAGGRAWWRRLCVVLLFAVLVTLIQAPLRSSLAATGAARAVPAPSLFKPLHLLSGRAPRKGLRPRKSSWECFELPGSTKTTNVLGRVMGTNHYCILRDFCMTHGSRWTFFDSAMNESSFDYPKQALLQQAWSHFVSDKDRTLLDAAADGRYVHDNDDDSQLTVITRTSYCCGHIKHFLEPVPTLHEALRDLEADDSRRQAAGLPSNFTVRRAFIANGQGAGQLNAFNNFLYHAAVGGERNPDFEFSDGLYGAGDMMRAPLCFRRALVPGAIYHLFQSPQQGKAFRSAVWARLSRAKQAAVAKGANATELLANEVDGKFQKSDERVIVYARRRGKRCISDDDRMLQTLNRAAGLVGARVLAVEMGKLDVVSQLTVAQRADVLIGPHGADLTNLILQRDEAVTVEMNPVFFFENAFHDIAEVLGVGYTAWTCTAPSCAFAGDAARWNRTILPLHYLGLHYNHADRRIKAPGFEPFQWPWHGYAASCHACDKSSCCTPFATHFYRTFRDSSIKVGDHEGELFAVLASAFQRCGWTIPEDLAAISAPLIG